MELTKSQQEYNRAYSQIDLFNDQIRIILQSGVTALASEMQDYIKTNYPKLANRYILTHTSNTIVLSENSWAKYFTYQPGNGKKLKIETQIYHYNTPTDQVSDLYRMLHDLNNIAYQEEIKNLHRPDLEFLNKKIFKEEQVLKQLENIVVNEFYHNWMFDQLTKPNGYILKSEDCRAGLRNRYFDVKHIQINSISSTGKSAGITYTDNYGDTHDSDRYSPEGL